MDFPVPKLSATMETVKVLRWLKQVGDKVTMGEPLVELETDKATMEVESPADGTLEAVLGAEGEELSVGAVLARTRNRGRIGLSRSDEVDAADRRLRACARSEYSRRGTSILGPRLRVANPCFSVREAARQNEWDRSE